MNRDQDLVFMAVGDIFIAREAPNAFRHVQLLLDQADVLVGNQEVPIGDLGTPLPGKVESGSTHLKAQPFSAAVVAQAGFTGLSLANNHVMDFGPECLLQTIKLLREQGIAVSGAGRNLEEASRPARFEKKGCRMAMLGYTTVFQTPGYAAEANRAGVATVRVHTAYQAPHNVPYQPGTPAVTITIPEAQDLARMRLDIERAREVADIVIVQLHWGVAGLARVLGYMKEMGRMAVDAGADIVIGNHPHVLLGVELYRGKPICYSLNHFTFDYHTPWPGGKDAAIFKVVIRENRLLSCSLIPIMIDEQTLDVSPPTPGRGRQIEDALQKLSREFGTRLERSEGELILSGPVEGTRPPLRAPEVLIDQPPTDMQLVKAFELSKLGKL